MTYRYTPDLVVFIVGTQTVKRFGIHSQTVYWYLDDYYLFYY